MMAVVSIFSSLVRAPVTEQHTSLNFVFSTLHSSVLASWPEFIDLLHCMQALTSICTGLSKWTWKVLLEPSEKNFCAFDAKTFPLCFNSILRCEKLLSACFRNFLVSGFHAWYRLKYLILIQYMFIFCFIFSYSTGIGFT